MIRKADFADLDRIEEGYHDHFVHETEHGAYTVFKEGVYPTRQDAENALRNSALYVCETEGKIAGSIILDKNQPEEYNKIDWPSKATADRVIVIHLIMVNPRMAGKGIGYALVTHAIETAKKHCCTAVRLDTGEQNIPAVSLYKKMGFRIVKASSMNVGGAIPHKKHLFLEKSL